MIRQLLDNITSAENTAAEIKKSAQNSVRRIEDKTATEAEQIRENAAQTLHEKLKEIKNESADTKTTTQTEFKTDDKKIEEAQKFIISCVMRYAK